MKKIFLSAIVLALVAISLLSFGQNVQKLDEKNGYKDLKFGLPYDSLKQFLDATPFDIFLGDHIKRYHVHDIKHFEFEGVEFEDISVNFFDNQLSTVILTIKEYEAKKNFLDVLQKAYGKKSNNQWQGKMVTLSWVQGEPKEAYVYFISVPLTKKEDEMREKLKKEQKKKNEDASKKL